MLRYGEIVPLFYRATVLLVSLLLACGPTTSDTGGTSEGQGTGIMTGGDDSEEPTTDPQVTTGECLGAPATSTDGVAASDPGLCPDHGPADACCCFADGGAYVDNVCEQEYPCQQIELAYSYGTVGELELRTECPAAIDCALAALIKGEVGILRWRIGLEMGEEEGRIYIAGDGTGFEYHLYLYDLGCGVDPFVRRSLRTQAYFMECATRPAVLDRFECIRTAFVGEPIETCVNTLTCSAV